MISNKATINEEVDPRLLVKKLKARVQVCVAYTLYHSRLPLRYLCNRNTKNHLCSQQLRVGWCGLKAKTRMSCFFLSLCAC